MPWTDDTIVRVSLLIAVVSVGFAVSPNPVFAQSEPTCNATPRQERLSVIAPMAGEDPVWLVDGSFGLWQTAETPVKSVWVLARDVSGDLVVEGRLIGGMERVLFQSAVDGPRLERLTLEDPTNSSVAPGGATPEVLATYSFVPMYLVYPSAGCWEINVRLGSNTRQIIVEQLPAP